MDWYVEMNFQENDWWPKKKKKCTWKTLLLLLILNVFELMVFWYEKLEVENLFHLKGV